MQPCPEKAKESACGLLNFFLPPLPNRFISKVRQEQTPLAATARRSLTTPIHAPTFVWHELQNTQSGSLVTSRSTSYREDELSVKAMIQEARGAATPEQRVNQLYDNLLDFYENRIDWKADFFRHTFGCATTAYPILLHLDNILQAVEDRQALKQTFMHKLCTAFLDEENSDSSYQVSATQALDYIFPDHIKNQVSTNELTSITKKRKYASEVEDHRYAERTETASQQILCAEAQTQLLAALKSSKETKDFSKISDFVLSNLELTTQGIPTSDYSLKRSIAENAPKTNLEIILENLKKYEENWPENFFGLTKLTNDHNFLVKIFLVDATLIIEPWLISDQIEMRTSVCSKLTHKILLNLAEIYIHGRVSIDNSSYCRQALFWAHPSFTDEETKHFLENPKLTQELIVKLTVFCLPKLCKPQNSKTIYNTFKELNRSALSLRHFLDCLSAAKKENPGLSAEPMKFSRLYLISAQEKIPELISGNLTLTNVKTALEILSQLYIYGRKETRPTYRKKIESLRVFEKDKPDQHWVNSKFPAKKL